MHRCPLSSKWEGEPDNLLLHCTNFSLKICSVLKKKLYHSAANICSKRISLRKQNAEFRQVLPPVDRRCRRALHTDHRHAEPGEEVNSCSRTMKTLHIVNSHLYQHNCYQLTSLPGPLTHPVPSRGFESVPHWSPLARRM